jgi:hypothetical protein
MVRITDHVNDEQLLEILLENQSIQDYRMEGLSGELITLYCMNRVGVDSPFSVVYEEICSLINGYITSKLVEDGLIEPEFTENGIEYICTTEGLKLSEMYAKLRGSDDTSKN